MMTRIASLYADPPAGTTNSFMAIMPFVARQRRSLAIAFCLMVGEAAVELSYPLFMVLLVDHGVIPGDVGQVLLWGLSMVALALLSFVFGISSTFFASDAGQTFAHDLRGALFRRLTHAPVGIFQRLSTASMLTRVTADVNQLQTAVFMCVRLYVRAPLIILGAVGLALWVDAMLALVLAVVTPLIALALAWSLKKGMGLFRLSQERLDALTGVLRENFNGMMLIRAFGRSGHELARFAEAGSSLRHRTAAAMQLSETVVPSLILLLNLCMLVILGLGERRIAAHTASPGDVIAILNYASRIIGEFSFLSMILTNLSMARSAMHRTADVLRGETENIGAPPRLKGVAAPPGIRAEDLGFAYPGEGAAVLRGISFDVPAGAAVAIVGSTGAGKTSLLQLLTRFHDPGTGRLLVDGTELGKFPLGAWRQRVGYVPQNPMLMSGTIRDNLLWGRSSATDADLDAAARRAQLEDVLSALPQGYDSLLNIFGRNLSGGQRQRLSIARALVRQPSLLLLDDCTSALDVRTEAALLASIRELRSTILFATQKVSVARWADIVLLLDQGRLVACGSHDDLLRKSALYREIALSQADGALVSVNV
jgi:ATP-binding cassette subfamily B protein